MPTSTLVGVTTGAWNWSPFASSVAAPDVETCMSDPVG